MNSLFARVLAALCSVAACAMGLAVLLQEHTLSRDLERAAEARLEAASAAAGKLLDNHLAAVETRYRAIAGTPQFRATLEVNDAPTLAHYAGSLLEQNGAARVAFLDAEGRVVAGAGSAELDAAAAGVESAEAVSLDGKAFAVASLPLARAGRLVAVEDIEPEVVSEWSELCGARIAFVPPGAPAAEGIHRNARALGALEMRVTASLDRERQATAHARWNLALAAALGLGAAFAMSIFFSRGLVQPILEIKTAAERVGSGDLTVTLRAERNDEIGGVAKAFEQMAQDLRATLEGVARAADRVDATATHISQAAGHLADVTQQQVREGSEAQSTLEGIGIEVQEIAAAAGNSARALDLAVAGSSSSFKELALSGDTLRTDASRLRDQVDEIGRSIQEMIARGARVAVDAQQLLAAVEETSQSMGEMEHSTRSVHEHAQETARLSDSVVEAAESGSRSMRETVAGMEAIRGATDEAQAVIRELRERAEKIGSVLEVIDVVTDETSLLALNASIIAAQSGEQGRAFAVVADEMKGLAERVQAGTKEIEGLVRALQQGSAAAVACIERGSGRVGEGVSLARQTELSLEKITQAARESGGRMEESVAATAEQLQAASHVVGRMEEVYAGAERIRSGQEEQVRIHAAVEDGSASLRGVAHGVQETIDAQARGAARIGEIIETVRSTVADITRGLEAQATSSSAAADTVKQSRQHTRSHEESAAKLGESARELTAEAEVLREAIRRFRI